MSMNVEIVPTDLGFPTEAVLATLIPPLDCLASALVNNLDGTEAERVDKARRLFAVALDRIFAEAGS